MKIEPKKNGEGIEFTQSLVGQNVDRVFVPSVEKGVKTACSDGILAGYNVVDIKIDFTMVKCILLTQKILHFKRLGNML